MWRWSVAGLFLCAACGGRLKDADDIVQPSDTGVADTVAFDTGTVEIGFEDTSTVTDTKVPGAIGSYPDFDGDSRADLWCYGPPGSSDFGRFDVALSNAAVTPSFAPSYSLPDWCKGADEGVGAADFDGDGRSEVFCTNLVTGNMRIARADGAKLVDQGVKLTGMYCRTYETIVGDFDGDGREDLACMNEVNPAYDVHGSNVWIVLSRESGFVASGSPPGEAVLRGFCDWTTDRSNVLAEWGAGDIDGDGRADLWCHALDDTGARAGKTFWARSDGTVLVAGATPLLTDFCAGAGAHAGAADLDGDGDVDFYCHYASVPGAKPENVGRVLVAINDKGTFTAASDWMASWCTRPNARVGTGDFDGDRRSDLYCHDDLGTTLALSTGSAFVPRDGALAGCVFTGNMLHSRD